MASRGTALTQCSNCTRYRDTESNWIALLIGSPQLAQFAIAKWIESKAMDVTVEDATILYGFQHWRRFCVSVQFINNGDRKRKTGLQWFTVTDGMCPDCQQLMRLNVQPCVMSCVALANPSGREDNMKLFREEFKKVEIETKEIDPSHFLFQSQRSAFRMINFVRNMASVRVIEDMDAVSPEERHRVGLPSNTWACTLEFPPIAKDDLVLLPRKNGILCICLKASQTLKFANPASGVVFEMTPEEYWQNPFTPLKTSKDSDIYYVSTVTPVGLQAGRMQVCSLVLTTDAMAGGAVTATSYMGLILQPGDMVKAYDLRKVPDVPDTDLLVYSRCTQV